MARLITDAKDHRTRYVRIFIPHWRWGGLLYGLEDLSGRKAVLVEGAFDREALQGQGLPTVAYGAAHLSERQALHLARLLDFVVLMPDNEEEARRQSRISEKVLRDAGIGVTVLYTPGYKDAAEWVSAGCPGSLLRRLKGLTSE